VKAVLYNRILLFLGFAGVFVAGVLSLARYMNVVPPCGAASSGCATVESDPSSVWFGVYVGYIGLAGYLLLLGLALARTYAEPKRFRTLTMLGYPVAAIGALISICLQGYSIFSIHATCKWCLASAVTMCLTLIVYALLASDVSEEPRVAATDENAPPATVTRTVSPLDFFLPTGLTVALIAAMIFMHGVLIHSDHVAVVLDAKTDNVNTLVPDHPNQLGDPNAPVTIVEFADLNCPSCKLNEPILKQFVHDHPRVRLVYRHLPLKIHPTSALAAAIDVYASEKGKFWDYTTAVMSQKDEVEDTDELFDLAAAVGLNVDDIKKRLSNDNDPIYQRLTDDENAAGRIGVKATPTFIVLAPNVKPNAFGPSELKDALNEPPYSKIINGS
jgi:protein-disulfide isomerase